MCIHVCVVFFHFCSKLLQGHVVGLVCKQNQFILDFIIIIASIIECNTKESEL